MADTADTTDTAGMPSFRIDLTDLCVWRTVAGGDAVRVKLTPKAFDVLRYLVEHAGRLVTHDELLQALWRDVHVQPEVLKSHVLAIRTALGDQVDGMRFIETQRGRGYRFIGPIDGRAVSSHSPASLPQTEVFAGRAAPLRELLGAFERAVAGEPQTVFVRGEPGIGKTTLIRAFLDQARRRAELLVAEGHCIEGFAGAEPYYPLLEALGALCNGPAGADIARTLVALAPAWAVQMPAQIPLEQRAAIQPQLLEGARGRMVREAVNLVEALAAERPLVLVLEDLHWADYASIDFLSAICRRRSTARLMLIATYRPEDLGAARHPLKQITHDLAMRRYCTEIELAPLSSQAIADLLQGGPGGAPAGAALLQHVQERSGGNPLFMRITLDHLVERGVVARVGHGWQIVAALDESALETPPTLGRLIEARFDGMTDEQQRVLEAASVAGVRFDPASTAGAAGMEAQAFEAVCEQMVRNTGVIHRDELLTLPDHDLVRTYAFNHEVYQQVLYDRIAQTRRARLHRAIGEALEALYPPGQRDDLAVRLAQHFAAARDWPRALDYVRAALAVAHQRFARRDALAILDRAFELTAHLPASARNPAEIEFLERRAVIQAAGHDPDCRTSYQRLAEKAGRHGDIDTQIRALLGLSHALSWNDLGESLRVLDEVLVLCDKQDDPLKQDFTRITAYVRHIWGAGWNREAARRCEAALARLRAQADARTIARAELNFSMICMVSTRYREAHDFVSGNYRLLRERAPSLADADLARLAWMVHIGVPWSLFSLGEFGAALAAFDASSVEFEKNGDVSVAHSLRIYRGVLLFHALDFEGVLGTCRPVAESVATSAAYPLDGQAVQGDRVLPVERRISLILCGLAEAGLGRPAQALGYLRTAEEQMDRQPVHLDWYWRLAMEWGQVNASIAEGNHATAQQVAAHLTGLAEQTDELAWRSLAWEARARAALSSGAMPEAIAHMEQALTACAEAHVPLAGWRVHASAAAVFAAAGDPTRAAAHADASALARQRLAMTMPEGHPVRQVFERRSGVAMPR